MSDTPQAWYEHRVSYGETDAMGVCYYAEYLHIFERGRSHFTREYGMSYALMEEKGLFLPVREASIKYRRPARYDDLLRVRVYIQTMSRATISFGYETFAEDQKTLLNTGFTQHACVNSEGRPIRIPVWLTELFS